MIEDSRFKIQDYILFKAGMFNHQSLIINLLVDLYIATVFLFKKKV